MAKSIFYQSGYIQTLANDIKRPLHRSFRVLLDPRAGIIQKVRAGREALKALQNVGILPEPTAGNVGQNNSRILVGIRDYFFARLKNLPMHRELRLLVNLVIIIYDTDFYRPFINVWVDELRKSDWEANGPLQPDHHYWNHSGGE